MHSKLHINNCININWFKNNLITHKNIFKLCSTTLALHYAVELNYATRHSNMCVAYYLHVLLYYKYLW